MVSREWIRIEVACSADAADELAMEAAEVFKVATESTETGIRFYLDGNDAGKTWEPKLRQMIEDTKYWLNRDFRCTYSATVVPEEDWSERWKEHFKPLRVGKRFIICPTWEEFSPGESDIVISMDPGRAFGTGHHETTRLCLEWLERLGEKASGLGRLSLLDIGAGSGILSIAGGFLGFGRIVAVDIDPEALEVASQNAELNGMRDRIELMEGTPSGINGRFDVAVANIQSLPLISMVETISDRLKKSGRMLALSGILVEQANDVRQAYESAGFAFLEEVVAGEWCLLEFA